MALNVETIVSLAAYIGGGLAMGLGAIGAAIGEGYTAAQANVAVSRDPKNSGEIFKNMLVGQAVAESASIFALVIAILLDNKPRGEAVFRTIFLYPMSLSFIVTGTIWRWMLSPQGGVNILPTFTGFKPLEFRWLSSTGAILEFNWQNLLQIAPRLVAVGRRFSHLIPRRARAGLREADRHRGRIDDFC